MKPRHFIVTALTTAMLLTMGGATFAKGSDPVQQKPMQSAQQQMPVKQSPQQKPIQQHQQQKARFIRVHRGDTLSGIAHKYRTRVSTLKRLNHLRGDTIFAGQRLRIR
ncbi:LysM peptidoglycan-binding domain-containing protein [Thiothrix lacustris]|uniref:LysM peptidoglycan-binding domain-containing protein n=1 Tax=Thiothrix lacustris TaxID=525917 RepID=UPI0027E4CD6C|nr:LysM peptidoglycan-binding domain-containing protein [Thiothrix lacustris]WMP17903.1 LysM peptidoglycan-binding domain-containing protein [Thiothrix lacustris]